MSFPILYDAKETKFDHNGIGVLSSCVSCLVTEETSGYFELQIKYPTNGIHLQKIVNGSLIKAKTSKTKNPQIFRVYSISKPMFKIVTISAQHISYDLAGIPVKPFSIRSTKPNLTIDVKRAFEAVKENSLIDNPFTIETDIDSAIDQFGKVVPASVRSCLIGQYSSLQAYFGGTYEYDNYTIKLHKNRGKDLGTCIKYGKNLINLKQEENISNVYTGVYPYWATETGYIELDSPIVRVDGKFNHEKILVLNVAASFEDQPDKDNILKFTNEYIYKNNIGVPAVSLEISFVPLSNFEGYSQLKDAEEISVYDTVGVEFDAIGVSAKAIVSKTVFDSINEIIEKIYLGSAVTNIADTIAEIIKPSRSE